MVRRALSQKERHKTCNGCIVEEGSYCPVCSTFSRYFFSARQVNFHCCGKVFDDDIDEFLEGSDVGVSDTDDESILPESRVGKPQPEPELSDGDSVQFFTPPDK